MIILFWWGLVIVSYWLYPKLMKLLAARKSLSRYSIYQREESLPTVSVVMSIHNEETILKRKLQSIFESNYPLEKIKIFIGLDDCTDGSEAIVQSYQNQFAHQIEYFSTERIGKPKMLNLLMRKVENSSELVIFTDANVIFTESLIYELSKYFKDPRMGLVDSKFVLEEELISHQLEKDYLDFEQQLKNDEGIYKGCMIGPFGGCFAVRTQLFHPIPDNFLVDDFFIGMKVLQQGYDAILNKNALVIEEVHTEWKDEYKRKRRIAAGNFQNLMYFKAFLFPPFSMISFAYFFHKVIRWMLPILLLPFFFISILYSPNSGVAWITISLIIGIVVIQSILQKLNLHSKTIYRLSYFIYINLALLQGFIDYIKGIESNVWKPTQRK